MSEFFKDIIDSLTEEEKLVLENIQDKISSFYEEQQKIKKQQLELVTDPVIDFADNHPDLIHSKNITTAPNELIFTLKAEASSLNSKGELESIVEIIEKFYHIPLTSKDDYHLYMDSFFNKFHSTLEENCRVINLDKTNEK
jgi:hypothetical protein